MQLNAHNVFQNIIVTTENMKNYTPMLPSTLWELQKKNYKVYNKSILFISSFYVFFSKWTWTSPSKKVKK